MAFSRIQACLCAMLDRTDVATEVHFILFFTESREGNVTATKVIRMALVQLLIDGEITVLGSLTISVIRGVDDLGDAMHGHMYERHFCSLSFMV
jgi:hypothetical protein